MHVQSSLLHEAALLLEAAFPPSWTFQLPLYGWIFTNRWVQSACLTI